jgi:transposase
LLVRAGGRQLGELVAWADTLEYPRRTWAIESAGGLGYLLAQRLLAAMNMSWTSQRYSRRGCGLSSGASNKNDPSDALAVAVAALHAEQLVTVRVEDKATFLR